MTIDVTTPKITIPRITCPSTEEVKNVAKLPNWVNKNVNNKPKLVNKSLIKNHLS